jgi:hypothetical protein
MRVSCLAGAFLLASSILCCATDPPADQKPAQVNASTKTGITATTLTTHRGSRRRLFTPGFDDRSQYEHVCYTLRTYIVVREERSSDSTRRDGEIVCQPAWKFQTRSAVLQESDQ